MDMPAFRQEMEEAFQKMFPPSILSEKNDMTVSVLNVCQRRSLASLDDDDVLFIWQPKTSRIHRYFSTRNEWESSRTNFDPRHCWFGPALNATWSISGRLAVIFGGAKISIVDLSTGDFVVSQTTVQFVGDLPEDFGGHGVPLEHGQLEYSSHLHAWVFAYFAVDNVFFFRLSFPDGVLSAACLERLKLPDLPLGNFEDFPTRFFLIENGSKVMLYNAMPFAQRPARNTLYTFPLNALELSLAVDWSTYHVTEELEAGNWRKRFHPRIGSLFLQKDELYALDYEWQFCYPDTGYGTFRLCKLALELEINFAHWEIQREIIVSNPCLRDNLHIWNGAHVGRLEMVCPDSQGRLYFLVYGSTPELQVNVCRMDQRPTSLQTICATRILENFPQLKWMKKEEMVAKLGLGKGTIDKNFGRNPEKGN